MLRITGKSVCFQHNWQHQLASGSSIDKLRDWSCGAVELLSNLFTFTLMLVSLIYEFCRCDLTAHNASVLTIENLATMNGTVTFPQPTVIDHVTLIQDLRQPWKIPKV